MNHEGAGRLHTKAGRYACDEHALSVEILAQEHVIGGWMSPRTVRPCQSPSSMDAPLSAPTNPLFADLIWRKRRVYPL